MAFISYEDLNNSLHEAGDASTSVFKKAANGVADFACGLYKDYPWAFTGVVLNGFNRSIWDNLCRPRSPGLPQPPQAPFNGGQCVDVLYNVGISYKNTVAERYAFFWVDNVHGPVGGVSFDKSKIFLSAKNLNERIRYPQQGSGSFLVQEHFTGELTDAYIALIRRSDGQPDNCGDPAANYPNTPIPESRKSGDVVITNGDGTSFNIPVIVIPVSGEIGATFKLADTLVFNFGLDGVSSDDDVNNSGGTEGDEDEDEDSTPDDGDESSGNEDEDDNEPEPPEGGNYTKVTKDGGNSGDFRDISNLHWVSVELTNIPTNAKQQAGGNAYDLFYAGWFQFIVDGKYLPRESVSFQWGVFKCPQGATGYAYTLYTGFTCSLTEYIKESTSDDNDSTQSSNATG